MDIAGQVAVSAKGGLEIVKRGSRMTSLGAIAEVQAEYDGKLV